MELKGDDNDIGRPLLYDKRGVVVARVDEFGEIIKTS